MSKKVRILSSNLGESNKVSLSDLAFGDRDYGNIVENSFIELNEKEKLILENMMN